jgi:hypothetical protein
MKFNYVDPFHERVTQALQAARRLARYMDALAAADRARGIDAESPRLADAEDVLVFTQEVWTQYAMAETMREKLEASKP